MNQRSETDPSDTDAAPSSLWPSIIVLVLAIGVCACIFLFNVFIVPVFLQMFDDFDAKLPRCTVLAVNPVVRWTVASLAALAGLALILTQKALRRRDLHFCTNCLAFLFFAGVLLALCACVFQGIFDMHTVVQVY